MGFLLALFLALPALLQTDGLRVEPTWGIASHYAMWTVTYEVGPGGLRAGGALRVQLPDTWHAGLRNSANRLQATDPAGDHYVSAEASRTGVRLTAEVESESPNFLVKSSRPRLDGRMERYVFVVRVTVAEGELQAGDAIRVVYGDTRGGSRGMRAAILSTRPEPILAAVDGDGDAAFEAVSHEATLTANSGIAASLRLSGPATLVVGEPADLHLAAVDLYENPVTQFRDEVALRILQGDAEVPAAVRLDPGRGHRTVSFTPRATGIVRLEAVTRAGILRTRGNPMQVFAEAPAERIYWGDLHSHTRHSFEGVGDGVFDYARYVSGLDFHAVTDHSQTAVDGFTRGLGPRVWEGATHRANS